MDDVFGFAILSFSEVHVQKRLLAILCLIDDLLIIGCPCHTRDQQVGRLILECINPANVAARGIHNTEFDGWVWIARLWISRDLEVLVIRNVIDYGELRNGILIKTQKSNGG